MQLLWGDGMTVIRGNDSPNALLGTAGDDVIFGNGGDDTINGGSGNDRILGGAGTESASGGAGNDTFIFYSGAEAGFEETIDGGSGFDTLLLSSAQSTPGAGTLHFDFEFATIASIERLQLGSALNDITANITLSGLASTPFSPRLEFVGGAGADTVNFQVYGNLDLRGATFTNWHANDHVAIHAWDRSTVNGTGQADDIWVEGSFGLLKGNGGDDVFHLTSLGVVQEKIDGGAGRDSIVLDETGHLAQDALINIEDIVFAWSGAPDAPEFRADFYSDAFDVGMANPFFHFVDADAQVNAVQVFMTFDNSFSAAGFTFENWGAGNVVGVFGSGGSDTITGSVVNDELDGQGGNDLIRSGLGDDSLFGGAGDDRMNGGDGNDQLSGESGADILVGGLGNDSFAYLGAEDSGIGATLRDRILDFSLGDKIDLSALDASATMAGDQAFVLDADGVLTEGEIQFAGHLNTVIRINLDADPEADMEIVLKGVAPGSLSPSDFIL
jgi:Ca2+-binding RTX toxin-like protein